MNKNEKILKVKELIRELKEVSGFPAKVGRPMSAKEIQEMEKTLGLKLPQEYKEFLQTFGSLGVVRMEIEDGYSVVKETLSLRENYPDRFPNNLVAVYGDGYGNYYCIVCDGPDYGKVIFWQHDAPLKETYPRYPEGQPDFWLEGPDFWTWLLEKLRRIKKIEEEEKKQKRE